MPKRALSLLGQIASCRELDQGPFESRGDVDCIHGLASICFDSPVELFSRSPLCPWRPAGWCLTF